MHASLLPQDRHERALFVAFLIFLGASCIAPPYPDFMLMQHAPTLLAALSLPYLSNRFGIGRFSFTSIILFLGLHTLGARYLYTYVPYDAWAEKFFGFNVSQTFGFERNHYDRLVHFSYGLLLAIPIQEFERRHLMLPAALSSVLAVECILATSAGYELFEWLVAVLFAPDWSEAFLGQQGDIFDGQKDMALALAGAVCAVSVWAVVERCRGANGERKRRA
jgi:putative membrane protein